MGRHGFSLGLIFNMFILPEVFKNKFIISAFAAAAALLIIAFSFYYVKIAENGNLLVIHFDSYKGIDFFGDRRDVLDIIISGFVIFLINLALTKPLYSRERFLAYAIAVSMVIFTVLILLAVNVIISVN